MTPVTKLLSIALLTAATTLIACAGPTDSAEDEVSGDQAISLGRSWATDLRNDVLRVRDSNGTLVGAIGDLRSFGGPSEVDLPKLRQSMTSLQTIVADTGRLVLRMQERLDDPNGRREVDRIHVPDAEFARVRDDLSSIGRQASALQIELPVFAVMLSDRTATLEERDRIVAAARNMFDGLDRTVGTIATWLSRTSVPPPPPRPDAPRELPLCAGIGPFGKFPLGGGCNAFGCFAAGGSCNAFGCSKIGKCDAFGCPLPQVGPVCR